jgi:hypothetical protein
MQPELISCAFQLREICYDIYEKIPGLYFGKTDINQGPNCYRDRARNCLLIPMGLGYTVHNVITPLGDWNWISDFIGRTDSFLSEFQKRVTIKKVIPSYYFRSYEENCHLRTYSLDEREKHDLKTRGNIIIFIRRII